MKLGTQTECTGTPRPKRIYFLSAVSKFLVFVSAVKQMKDTEIKSPLQWYCQKLLAASLRHYPDNPDTECMLITVKTCLRLRGGTQTGSKYYSKRRGHFHLFRRAIKMFLKNARWFARKPPMADNSSAIMWQDVFNP